MICVSGWPTSMNVTPSPPKPERGGRNGGSPARSFTSLLYCVNVARDTQTRLLPRWIGVTPSTASSPLFSILPPLKTCVARPVDGAGTRCNSKFVVFRWNPVSSHVRRPLSASPSTPTSTSFTRSGSTPALPAAPATVKPVWLLSCGVSSSVNSCLLYTSDAADERSSVDLGG